MNLITQFNVLIHPDYHAMNVKPPQINLYPLQTHLRSMWEKRAQFIRKDPSLMLIYISSLDQKELSLGLQNPSALENPVQLVDIERIKRFQELLGDRFNLIANQAPITRELLVSQADQEPVSYDPENSKLFAFGEYFGGQYTCVERLGGIVQKKLDIPWVTYLTDYCFGIDSVIEVERWRGYKGAGPERF